MKIAYRRLVRTTGYTLLFSLIVLTTIVLVALGRGYRVDWQTKQLYGTGLLIVDSAPRGAAVSIDGISKNASTGVRLSLKSGQYLLGLHKDGYHDWQKSVGLLSSEVTFVQYPLLVPKAVPTKSLYHSAVTQVDQSPNRQLVAMARDGSKPSLVVFNLNQNTAKTVYELPARLGSHRSIKAIAWATDSNQLLLTVRGRQTEQIVLDVTKSGNAFDITTSLKVSLSQPVFAASDSNLLYGLVGGELRRVNLRDKTLSAVLVDHVTGFRVVDSDVYAVVSKNSHQLVRFSGGTPQIVIKKLSHATYQLEAINHGGNHFLVLLDKTSGEVAFYDTRLDFTLASRFTTEHIKGLLPSADDRFLLMVSGNHLASYDFEQAKLYRFTLDGDPGDSLAWFDNFHLTAVTRGQLKLFEFDGGNAQSLVKAGDGFATFPSRNKQAVYSVRASDGRTSLQVSDLAL